MGFFKELFSRLPNWVFVSLVSCVAGVFATIFLTGSTLSVGDIKVSLTRHAQAVTIPVTVESIAHASRSDGTYFNFDPKEIDAVIGSDKWSELWLYVSNTSSKKRGFAAIWRSSNGGPKNLGHGRFEKPSPSPGDWAVGDTAEVLIVSRP